MNIVHNPERRKNIPQNMTNNPDEINKDIPQNMTNKILHTSVLYFNDEVGTEITIIMVIMSYNNEITYFPAPIFHYSAGFGKTKRQT